LLENDLKTGVYLRITGGFLKGRILKTPKSDQLRPTSDKVRQAIFSSLGSDIVDSSIADLFCGTGALGIEALSRGAKSALFIDKANSSISLLKKNIDGLELDNQAEIVKMDVFRIRPAYFNDISIIFADPPYRKGYCHKLLSLLSLSKFGWHGIIMFEHEADWSYDYDTPTLLNRLDFGDTSVSFFKLRD
jgi:16S rRNA (guanine966-N2)-methyltransferase